MLGPVILAASRSDKMRRFISAATGTKQVVDRFIDGETVAQVVPIIEDAADKGIEVTLDVVGEDITTRFYVTDGPDGPRIDDPDLQLGFGIYARTDDLVTTTLDGDFPQTLERDGHVWQLVERQDAPAAD